MKRLLPTPSMVVAILALIVALSGSAYAVTKIGTAQIKSNAVTTPKIRNGAVTGPKLRGQSVSASKLAPGVVPNGDANWVDDSFFMLTGDYQTIISQDLQVKAGQTFMTSVVANIYQSGVGTDTRAWCRLFGYPPDGSSSVPMSPLMYASLGTSGQDIEFPLVGYLDATQSGLWRATMECRKFGSGNVNTSGSSMLAWAVRP